MAHTLERVWMFAMVLLFITSFHMGMPTVNCTAYTSASRITLPMMLKYRWISAARLPSLEEPPMVSSGVNAVPMWAPRMMGMAELKVTRPVLDNACRIPTDAEEDWMTTVTTTPTRMPRMGFVMVTNRFWNTALSRRGATPVSIRLMPVNRMPKPSMIWPMFFFLALRRNT